MKNRLKGRFFQGENSVVNNKEISLQAKGLYSFLCSKPDNWDFSYRGMQSQLKEGDKAIRSAVRELVNVGVLIRIRAVKQLPDGKKYSGFDWILHPTKQDLLTSDEPIKNSSKGTTPKGDDPKGDDPKGDDPKGDDISNTKRSNTKRSNTKVKESENSFNTLFDDWVASTNQYYDLKDMRNCERLFFSLDDSEQKLSLKRLPKYLEICKGYESRLNFYLSDKKFLESRFNKTDDSKSKSEDYQYKVFNTRYRHNNKNMFESHLKSFPNDIEIFKQPA